jgi:hypothetical protein
VFIRFLTEFSRSGDLLHQGDERFSHFWIFHSHERVTKSPAIGAHQEFRNRLQLLGRIFSPLDSFFGLGVESLDGNIEETGDLKEASCPDAYF